MDYNKIILFLLSFSKHYFMRSILTFLFLVSFYFYSSGQNWSLANLQDTQELGLRDIKPSIFKLYKIDDQSLKVSLFKASHESEVSGAFDSPTQIQLPTADGRMHTFAMVTYHLLHPDLQKQYPDIKAFYGICLENATMTVVADYSPTYGFRAVVSQPGVGKTYIDHFQRNDLNHRIVYYRKDYQKFSNWKCGVVSEKHDSREIRNGNRASLIGDCLFREYRLALACTGEYATFHGGTIAGALAAMNTTMNRVNGVFAQEIAIRCVIIANNTNIIYTNGATDPYTNGDAGAMLDENQTTCDGVIGSANYDIGHVFGTNSGGVAGLGVVCINGSKAYGVTGSGSPVGDPFDIDYVAHEMGHQLGGPHTFNGDAGFCSGNRNAATAMEPGSGSSIMAYAGICSPQNVQNNSDENFHAISLQNIKTFLAAGGSNCDIPVAGYTNDPPNISAPANNTTYNIPRSTPFALTMTATDPNGNGILYGWDQMNNNVATMPPVATNTVGPMFRFLEPSTNPTRYFPNLTAVLTGALVGAPFGGNNWEVIPSVARTMNFRGVARDITPMSASCNSEVNVIVNTVASTGPFRITGLDVATTWLETDTKTITWDVAGSNAGTINTANVSILMSYDGGNTFPVTLLASTPNDGSQQIVVPVGTTTTARIMVRAVGNIFFDINNANITVNTGVPSFGLSLSTSTINLCPNQQSSVTLDVSSILGFINPVDLTLSGLPSGLSAAFATNPVIPGQSTSINFDNLSASPGSYTIQISGISGALMDDINVTANILPSNPITTLITPINNAASISVNPTLNWSLASGTATYDLQLSRKPDFSNTILNISGIMTNSYLVTTPLLGYSEYFWRVRAMNSCGTGDWSNTSFKFGTESCMVYTSTDVPKNIVDNTTITSNLPITDKGTINDLDILDLEGTHTWVGDLRFRIISPANTSVLFWNRPCNSGANENFDINFNQGAAAGAPPCPPTNGGTYRPNGSGVGTLNSFNTQSVRGNWRLTIRDTATQDEGVLQKWSVKTCMTNFCRLRVDSDAIKGAGSLFAAISCAAAGDTIRFASNFMNDTINLGNDFLNINKSIFIEGDISKNIHIFCSSTSPTIVAAAPNTGFGLKIKGLHIHSSNATDIGAIQNSGLLNLEDVYVYPNATAPVTVQHNTGATINIAGDCRVLE
jgi:subtilisin-like proprotein convertase family protein